MNLAITDELIRRHERFPSPETLVGGHLAFGSASSHLFEPTASLWVRHADSRVGRAVGTLARLTNNWDSYGAEPLSREILDRTRDFVSFLMSQNVPLPDIAPASSGAIFLNWRSEDIEIEIELDPEHDDSVFARYGTTLAEYEGPIAGISGFEKETVEVALTRLTQPDSNR